MKLLEIKKLIESDIHQIRDIGRLLYNIDINKGLNQDDVYNVIKLLSEINIEGYTEKDLEDSFDAGYSEGYDKATEEYESELDCEFD